MFAIFPCMEHNKTTTGEVRRERNYGKFYVGLKFKKIKVRGKNFV